MTALGCAVALIAMENPVAHADTVASNNSGSFSFLGGGQYYGEAFTTAAGTNETNIVFNFYSNLPPTNPTAAGVAFLLSQQYLGSPGDLSSSTTGYLGQATAAGNVYSFSSSVVLAPATQYFLYENGAISPLTAGNPVAGQQLYTSDDPADNFGPFGPNDSANFLATGSPVLTAAFWDGRTNTLWTSPNWAITATDSQTTGIPSASTDVTFSITGGGANLGTTLGADFEIHSLTVNDTGAVTIGGSNMLTISGAGGTTGITVNSGAGLLTINANLTLAGSSQTITINNAAGAIINGAVGGSVGLDKEGAGALVLNGDNNYSGGTTLGQGTIGIGNDSALSSFTVSVSAGGGSIYAAGANHSINNVFSLNGGLTVVDDPNGAHNLTLTGALNGAGSLTMNGTGTLTLTASNGYGGGTNLNSGALGIGNDNALSGGTVTVRASGASVFAAGGAHSIGNSFSLAGRLTVVDDPNGAQNLTLSGQITGGGGLTMSGTGTLTLSSTTSNYSGSTVLDSGTISINNSSALGTSNIDLEGGALLASASMTLTNPNIDWVSGSSTISAAHGMNLTLTPSVEFQTNAGASIVFGSTGHDGTVTLGASTSVGAANVATLTVAAGTLTEVSGQTALGLWTANAASTTVASMATLDFNDNSSTIANLLGAGTVHTGAAAGTTLTVDEGTFSGAITGAGQLVKDTTGTLVLSGASSYTGATTVSDGTLQIGIHNALPTATTVTVNAADGNNDATLDLGGFNQAIAGVTLVAPNSGSTTVELHGGTLQVNGNLSVVDNTTINHGMGGLSIIQDSTGGGALDLGGAVRTFNVAGQATVGNDLQIYVPIQNGGVIINATPSTSDQSEGGVVFLAPNTYQGGTTVAQGRLTVVADHALPTGGAVTLGTANSALTGDIDLFGTRQTIGSLQIATGNTGGTGNFITSNGGPAVLTVDSETVSSSFSGLITGDVALVKTGPDSLTLTAANDYTGATTVKQGSLIVDGSIASANTIVMAGGLLGGHGTLGGNLNNSGVVSPGNSPGTLTVNGNFTQSSSGALVIEIGGLAPALHDLLAVGGSASLAGALQLQQLNGFQFKIGDKVTFLTAAGGVSGAFATVVNPFSTGSMVGAQVVYAPNSVSVESVQNSFVALVTFVAHANPRPSNFPWETQNQAAVAHALDASITNPRNAALIAHLDNETLDKVLTDLDRIAPEALTSVFQVAVSQARVQNANLQRRLEDVRSGSNGFSAAGLAMNGGAQTPTGSYEVAGPSGAEGKEGKAILTPAPDNRWGVFVTGTGEWASVGDTGNARGYDLTNAGFTLGIDYKLTDHFVVGLATGYDHSSADLANNGRIIVDGGKLALYSSYFTGQGFYTDLAVQGGYNGYDTHRAALDGAANGSANGGELNVLFGTGYDWKIGGLTFGPTGNFEYTYLGLDSYGERGSLAPLDFPNQHQESIRSTFGAKVSYDWKLGSVLVKPELRAGWQHEYGDATFGLDSSFANGAGPEFLVHGPATGRDSLLLSAGVAIQCSERVSTYVYYDGELARTNYQANSVSGGFRFDF